jgi:methionine synthase II (cobalamin-independent)
LQTANCRGTTFDDERSGDFAPLRLVPANKTIVLGLVTSKLGALETEKELTDRSQQAGCYVPLEQMYLSPQCGFSSTVEGNQITADQQWAKLERIVATARDVWKD